MTHTINQLSENSLEYKKTHLVSLMSYHDYTITEIKCVTALMYLAAMAQKVNHGLRLFQADIREVTRLAGITYNLTQLREIIHGIQSKPVVLNFIGKHGKRVESGALLSWVGVEEGDPVIDYEFPDRICSQLLRPEYFTLIKMDALVELGGKYAYFLYELCKSFVGVKTPKLDVETLRGFLGLTNEYPLFADFERCVIKPALREINDSDKIEISVKYKKERTGKKIGFVQFKVTLKEAKTPEAVDETTRTLDHLMLLLPYKSQTPKNREMLRGYLDDQGEEYIISNIQHAWKKCKDPDNSFSSYLAGALRKDYGDEICRGREMERKLHSMMAEDSREVNLHYLDPAADQIYLDYYETAAVEMQKEIRYEINNKLTQGKILKRTPATMQIRLAMQYLGYWL